MSLRDLLLLNNPWWEGSESPYLADWKAKELRWRPAWLSSLNLTPTSLNIIVGPRMVGKTTSIHLLISELLEGGADPRSLFYLNLDLAADIETFRLLLHQYLEIKRSLGLRNCYLFLDEVTSIKDWWKVVKGYVDAGAFRNDVLVLTGSSSLRLKGEAELFPSRMGGGSEVVAWPLSFREYLSVRGIAVEQRNGFDTSHLVPLSGRISGLFEEYMAVGGYPLSVNGDPRALEYAIRSVEGEVLRVGRDRGLAKEVISSLMRKAPSPVSYSSIGGDISISHRTVREYLELLEALMLLGQAPLLESGRVVWRKERKFFFLDTFMAKALSLWTASPYLESAAYEWVVQAHLLRRFGSIYYYRDSYEIDAIAGPLKVEVKVGKPHRRYPKDALILDSDDLPLFLALL